MRLNKHRWFLINGATKQMETITWLLAGTEPLVGLNDVRCVAIGETVTHPITGNPIDLWFPLTIKHPAFDVSNTVSYATESEKIIDYDPDSPTFGQTISVNRSVRTLSNTFDYYAEPLLSGYVEITEIQFNDPLFP